MIDECNILSALDEGLYSMSETIATILGTLKANEFQFSTQSNDANRANGHISKKIYQQHDELVLLFL